MAFLLNKTSLSQLRLQPQNCGSLTESSFGLSRRGLHVEPGAREKAELPSLKGLDTVLIGFVTLQLLANDPVLKQFKSHKKSVWRLKKVGDVLTIIVVAGCCYEIYVKAVMREEARKQARESA